MHDACALTKSELSSLDFIVNRFFMKLFKTNNIDVVKSCQLYFGFSLPSEEWVKRAKNLDAKYIACERAFVYYGNSMFYRLIMLCRRVCHCIFYIVFAI